MNKRAWCRQEEAGSRRWGRGACSLRPSFTVSAMRQVSAELDPLHGSVSF